MKEHHFIKSLEHAYKKYKYRILLAIGFIIGISLVALVIGRSFAFGETTSLTAFIIIHFAGYLFFILSAVELLFIHMVISGYNPYLLIFLALATAIPAQAIDYHIGKLASDKVIRDIIGEKRYEKSRGRIEKYGNPALFIFNVFPLSSPILILVAGMLKYDYKKVLLYSITGLTIKYSVIVLALTYIF